MNRTRNYSSTTAVEEGAQERARDAEYAELSFILDVGVRCDYREGALNVDMGKVRFILGIEFKRNLNEGALKVIIRAIITRRQLRGVRGRNSTRSYVRRINGVSAEIYQDLTWIDPEKKIEFSGTRTLSDTVGKVQARARLDVSAAIPGAKEMRPYTLEPISLHAEGTDQGEKI